jgi:hypothetical protein
MILYFPPKGTAGFGLPMVIGLSRSPLPPAMTMAMVLRDIFPLACIRSLQLLVHR